MSPEAALSNMYAYSVSIHTNAYFLLTPQDCLCEVLAC